MNNDLELWLNKSNDYSNEICFYTEESIRNNNNYYNYGKIIIIKETTTQVVFSYNLVNWLNNRNNFPLSNLWGNDKKYNTIKDFIEDTNINFFNKETNPELFI